MSLTIGEANDIARLLRVLQGLRRHDDTPDPVDDVVASAERLAQRAGKALLLTLPVSWPAVVQTLDHLAELDGEDA